MRWHASIFAATVACSAAPQPELPVAAAGPSVLLVTLDTTRADRIGAYGHALADTPTVDALAERGTRFARAYSTCPLTIPSHSTIFTGRAPPSHGVRDNGDYILGEEAITLAERFSDAGWATAAFTSAFPTQRRWGLAQGFDVYHDPLERRPTQLDWRDQRRADDVIDDALETLPTLGDAPLFVWVHLFDAHWPYDPPEPFASEHSGRPYDGEIAFADHHLGRLVEWWTATQPDSLVVVTADHGEGLGHGGEQTHGFLLHDGTIRVPLILAGPGVEVGRVVEEPVSHVDIAPTVLALAGLEVHPEVQGKDLRSGGSELSYSEALTGQFNLGLAPLFAWTGAQGRYMEGGWGGFYPVAGHHISAVPDPADDAALPGHAERLALLRAGFDEVIAPNATLDAASLELLSALGYMGGDTTAEAGEVDPRDVIDVVPLTWQARQLIGMGLFGRADELIATLDERMPETYGVDLLRAQLARRRGRLDLASEAFADLFLRSPSSTIALQLGAIHATWGDWVEARSWYEEAARLQPASPEAMSGRVRAAQALGLEAEAEELADEFLVIYPDHAELSLIRAELSIAEGRLDQALVEARRGLETMPYSPWAHTVVGQALWELGRADDAIERLQDALRLDPYQASVRLRLVDCLLEVGRYAEAVRIVAPLARLLPEDEEVGRRHADALEGLARERGE